MSCRRFAQPLTVIAICAICLLLFTFGATMFSADASSSPQIGVRLSTDKHTFRVGEPITFTLSVFNHTREPLTLRFRNAQRYNFLIENEAGKLVWRWSDGKMFAQMLGQVIIGPENPEVVFTETYTGQLVPGRYTLTGKSTDQDGFASASLTITIGPKPE